MSIEQVLVDLTTQLKRIADSLEGKATATPAETKPAKPVKPAKPEPEAKTGTKSEPVKTAAESVGMPAVTKADLQGALGSLIAKTSREIAALIVGEFGATNVSGMNADDYPAALKLIVSCAEIIDSKKADSPITDSKSLSEIVKRAKALAA